MFEQQVVVTETIETSMDDGLFTSLIDVLTKELSIYTELKEFLIQEIHKSTTLPSVNQINENNILKENIILKSRILEEVRINILRKIARKFDVDESTVKLMSLINHAKEDKKKIIYKIHNDILNMAKDVIILNNENKQKIDVYNNNINVLLDLLSSVIGQSKGYHNDGKIDKILNNGRLLHAKG